MSILVAGLRYPIGVMSAWHPIESNLSHPCGLRREVKPFQSKLAGSREEFREEWSIFADGTKIFDLTAN